MSATHYDLPIYLLGSPRTIAKDKLLVQAILSCRPQSPPWREEEETPDHVDEVYTELDQDEERSSDDLAAYQPFPQSYTHQNFSTRQLSVQQPAFQQDLNQQGLPYHLTTSTTSAHQAPAAAPQPATTTQQPLTVITEADAQAGRVVYPNPHLSSSKLPRVNTP